MLTQGIDIDLRPIGLRIGLQLVDDLLNRAKRGLTKFRGDCRLPPWAMRHHAAHRVAPAMPPIASHPRMPPIASRPGMPGICMPIAWCIGIDPMAGGAATGGESDACGLLL